MMKKCLLLTVCLHMALAADGTTILNTTIFDSARTFMQELQTNVSSFLTKNSNAPIIIGITAVTIITLVLLRNHCKKKAVYYKNLGWKDGFDCGFDAGARESAEQHRVALKEMKDNAFWEGFMAAMKRLYNETSDNNNVIISDERAGLEAAFAEMLSLFRDEDIQECALRIVIKEGDENIEFDFGVQV